MIRLDIEAPQADPLQREVWTFAVELFDGRVRSTLEQVHEQDRASPRHRSWMTVRRVRFITTRHENYRTGPQAPPWSRWADVTAFVDNRFYGRHDPTLPAIEPPSIPDHIARQLEERLKPTLALPSNRPKPETTP